MIDQPYATFSNNCTYKFKHNNTATTQIENINKPAQLNNPSTCTFFRSAAVVVMRGVSLLPVFCARVSQCWQSRSNTNASLAPLWPCPVVIPLNQCRVSIYLFWNEISNNLYWTKLLSTETPLFTNSSTTTPPPHLTKKSTNHRNSNTTVDEPSTVMLAQAIPIQCQCNTHSSYSIYQFEAFKSASGNNGPVLACN